MEKRSVRHLAAVLKCLVSITLACNVVAMFLVPMLARQRYVDLWLYQELLWDDSLVWQDPRGAASILLWWALGGCAAVLLWWARRKLRETGRNEE